MPIAGTSPKRSAQASTEPAPVPAMNIQVTQPTKPSPSPRRAGRRWRSRMRGALRSMNPNEVLAERRQLDVSTFLQFHLLGLASDESPLLDACIPGFLRAFQFPYRGWGARADRCASRFAEVGAEDGWEGGRMARQERDWRRERIRAALFSAGRARWQRRR